MPHPAISKIFVLMLENRSFDHMLGASGIPGIDGILDATGKIKSDCSNVNSLTGASVPAFCGAHDPFGNDPPHEFCDILMQLSGRSAVSANGSYPPISNSGFIDSFSSKFPYPGAGAVPYRCGNNTNNKVITPDLIMGCFTRNQLPILTTLARQYAVCDMWFSSLPGPTWPNRYYAHAASSSGLDGSPGLLQIANGYAIGQRFQNGTIFDRLDKANIQWEIFSDGHLSQSFALHGMTRALFRGKLSSFDGFKYKISQDGYRPQYIFIEPNYGHLMLGNYEGGNSQHPVDGIAGGEKLIRDVYEAIYKSPYWEESMLIIAYDEHGGFYDHVPPGAATPPGDRHYPPSNNQYGFNFDQLGVRVPAVIVSPYVSPGHVSHDIFNHASIPATVCRQFRMNHLTASDKAANDLLALLNLEKAQDGIRPEEMPEAPQALYEATIASLEDMPSGTPIKPITRGFLNVAVLKHQAIEGHNLEKNEFINAVEQYGVKQPHLMVKMIAQETSGSFKEIIDRYNAIKDEKSAQEYITEVIQACEQHKEANPHLYGIELA
ncbi:MAG: phosphoesterase [Proteobacteria bacterium]|nr:phosphoesterase [Pseudomonadota bacterium]